MSEWYYTRAGQQVGPVTSPQLRQAARSGELAPTDLVWKDGMAEWAPAGKINGLFTSAPAATAPVAAPAAAQPASAASSPDTFDLQPASDNPAPWQSPQPHHAAGNQPAAAIGYYNPTAGLGARLAAHLKGFPTPTGPQDQWPLADEHLGQLAIAESHRKHIRALAGLFQLFFALGIIGSIFVVIAVLIGLALSGGRRGPGVGFGAIGLVVNALFSVGLTILYYFAARETRRCRLWPAILFAVLYGLFILFIFGSVLFSAGMARPGPGPGPSSAGILGAGMFGAVLISIIPFAFLWMCIKAITAIPKFLACPVWAQEALVAAKL
jgi:hypothetical protein